MPPQENNLPECEVAPGSPQPLSGHPDSDDAWRELIGLVRATLNYRGSLRPDEIDDLVQDVFLALGCRMRDEDPRNLRGLAVTVAKCLRVKWFRRVFRAGNRRVPWSDGDAAILCTSPSMSGVDVADALALMADDTRMVFVAIAIDGRTQAEAANEFRFTRHLVRKLYAEAIGFLRRLWGDGPDKTRPPRTKKRASRKSAGEHTDRPQP